MDSSPNPPQPPSGKHLLGAVGQAFTGPMSSLVAVAMLVLAAGAALAVIGSAKSDWQREEELAMTPLVKSAAARAVRATGFVLGESVNAAERKPETQVLIKNKTIMLAAVPHEYSAEAGKWNYLIKWQRRAARQGSIYINGRPFVDNASSTGQQYTGYNLEPEFKYRIVFYSQPSGQGLRLANRLLKVLPAPETAAEQEDVGDFPGQENCLLNSCPPPTSPPGSGSSTKPCLGESCPRPVPPVEGSVGVKVLYPNGGETVQRGSKMLISWSLSKKTEARAVISLIQVFPCQDQPSGSPVCALPSRSFVIAEVKADQGQYTWEVGKGNDSVPMPDSQAGVPDGQYQVSVSVTGYGQDASDRPFFLGPTSAQP